MSEKEKDLLIDLLTTKAVYGLDEAQQKQFDVLDQATAEAELSSFEMTAAAIGMIDFSSDEAMPQHLFSKISADAEKFVGADSPWPPSYPHVEVEEATRSKSWFSGFGWAVAAAACVALAVNIWFTRMQPPVEVAKAPTPTESPKVLTPVEMRDAMLSSTPGIITANWAPGNVKELKDIAGDVVWSDTKQAGYLRIRGIPQNDANKETYQLWIFDKTQDKATPIDGGTFDVAANGEVVIPIDAKLNAQEPGMFAITIEQPGGVVVSKREKVVALATVETRTS